ncbi:MAG: class I SAM-dependent methyltransferase [Vulcanimicrobiaceae bacterium]
MARETLDAAYFARLYAGDPDPWQFATSDYERAKYRATIAALGDARFARGLEVGCSIGVLTASLAGVCDELLAIDIDPTALDAARTRNAMHGGVRFARMTFPSDVPPGTFDLVVLSEVAYYWSDADFERARDTIVRLAPRGTLELVHFTPVVADYVRTGDAVHETFASDRRFAHVRGERADRYRLDVLTVR